MNERVQKKIVIRRLPPDMTLESFMKQVGSIPPHNYIYIAYSDKSYGVNNSFARIYVNFLSENDLFEFKQKLNGQVFRSEKGVEYRAVVEYAPFQRIPHRNKVYDSLCGTVESSYYFKNFLAAQKEPAKAPEQPRETKEQKRTPLIKYLNEKKSSADTTKYYEYRKPGFKSVFVSNRPRMVFNHVRPSSSLPSKKYRD